MIATPLVVRLGNEDRAQVRKLLDAMDDASPLRIVAGRYGRWAVELVPANSAQGRVLAMGYTAVPLLLDRLDDNGLTPHRRAQILAMLFSLTGQRDPRKVVGVLGPYKDQEGPWAVQGGDPLLGSGTSGIAESPDGKIDGAAQKAFAQGWLIWKTYVRIESKDVV